MGWTGIRTPKRNIIYFKYELIPYVLRLETPVGHIVQLLDVHEGLHVVEGVVDPVVVGLVARALVH